MSSSSPLVAALIAVPDGVASGPSRAAVAAQTLQPRSVAVVGSAENDGFPDIASAVAALDSEITYVWVVTAPAAPRPDALAALVGEAVRSEAALAGCKTLRSPEGRLLLSVGSATDVFFEPFSGLEHEELDQRQYDVVRDVAFVAPEVYLIRRDLFRGLGGPDTQLPPEAAAIDLAARARLAGGAVVVVPSAEVLVADQQVPPWREAAGRIRVTLKSYSFLTLLWAVPLSILSGLASAFLRTISGQLTAIPAWVAAWSWNLLHVFSLFGARSRVRAIRVVGDEELFRYQVGGSVAMKSSAAEVSIRLRARSDDEDEVVEEFEGQAFWQRPGFGAGLLGATFVLLATWSLWFGEGMPVVGFSLPLAESGVETLEAYAGGWNIAGLGSPRPHHPSLGALALAQVALPGSGSFAQILATTFALGAGMVGASRLLRILGVGALARYAAAVVLIAGPAAQFVAGEAYWPALLGMGALPWAVAAPFTPLGPTWMRVVARLAGGAILTGLAAAFVPLTVLAPTLVAGAWALFGLGSFRPVLRAAAMALLALPLLAPWIVAISVDELVGTASALFWSPSWLVLVVVATAVVGPLVGSGGASAGVAATGAVVASAGLLLARLTEASLEVASAGVAASSVGLVLVVGAALNGPTTLPTERLWRQIVTAGGFLAGVGLVLSALAVIPAGRAGLPAGDLDQQLSFSANRADAHGPDRILLVGPPGSLPGSARALGDFEYRLVSAPAPTLLEAWLAPPRLGDEVLADVMASLVETVEFRPGATLSEFGVKWIYITGPTSFDLALEGQLDLVPLSLIGAGIFENENASPRAVTDLGTPWSWNGNGYEGRAETGRRLYVSENADPRWGTAWTQQAWANEVSAGSGSTAFSGNELMRRLAQVAGVVLVILLLMATVPRLRR